MTRLGHGFDAHRLVEGRRLVLGGITVPNDRGALGHSDADVLAHAISDAVLGAAAFVSSGASADEDQLRCYVDDGAAALPELLRLLDGEQVGLRSISLSEPTLDDVRGGENHFKIAVGCSVAVLLVVLAFGVLRVLLAA